MASLLSLFLGFLRVGALGFGGGQSMVPLIQRECVGAGWITDEQFLEGLAAGNALPGPISVKLAVYVGYNEAGLLGAAVSVIGVSAPAVVLMAVLGGFLVRYREHWLVAAALKGVKPAVVGMLFWVAWDLGKRGVTDWSAAFIALAAFFALTQKVHPGVVMGAAMVLGLLLYRP